MGCLTLDAEDVRIRPLHCWHDTTLRAAAARLQALLVPWVDGWELALDEVQAVDACDNTARPGCWLVLAGVDAQLGYTPVDDGDPPLLALLFGRPQALKVVTTSSTLAAETAMVAWHDLGATLAQALPAGLATTLLQRPWSGALRLLFNLSGAGQTLPLQLLLGPHAAAAWCTDRQPRVAAPVQSKRTRLPLVPVTVALASRQVQLAVHLAPVELDLGSLQTLRINDVLTLPHLLDDALMVQIGVDAQAPPTVLCQAHLGGRGGRLAIELVRSVPLLANPAR